MKKHLDGRKLDRATLEKLRIRAVSLVVEEGKSPEVVVAALGFHRSCIYDWLRRYNEGGWDALKSRPLPGRNRTVNEDMEEQLLRIVTERSPEDLRFRVRDLDPLDDPRRRLRGIRQADQHNDGGPDFE